MACFSHDKSGECVLKLLVFMVDSGLMRIRVSRISCRRTRQSWQSFLPRLGAARQRARMGMRTACGHGQRRIHTLLPLRLGGRPTLPTSIICGNLPSPSGWGECSCQPTGKLAKLAPPFHLCLQHFARTFARFPVSSCTPTKGDGLARLVHPDWTKSMQQSWRTTGSFSESAWLGEVAIPEAAMRCSCQSTTTVAIGRSRTGPLWRPQMSRSGSRRKEISRSR